MTGGSMRVVFVLFLSMVLVCAGVGELLVQACFGSVTVDLGALVWLGAVQLLWVFGLRLRGSICFRFESVQTMLLLRPLCVVACLAPGACVMLLLAVVSMRCPVMIVLVHDVPRPAQLHSYPTGRSWQ
uniref:Uncharacterized protein n=1 Tax=Anopheles darlingi TaxID=43151 RepID=A0A2M4D1L4_ANODA